MMASRSSRSNSSQFPFINLCYFCEHPQVTKRLTSNFLQSHQLKLNRSQISTLLRSICQLLKIPLKKFEKLFKSHDLQLPFCYNCLNDVGNLINFKKKLEEIERELRKISTLLKTRVSDGYSKDEKNLIYAKSFIKDEESSGVELDEENNSKKARKFFRENILIELRNKELLEEKLKAFFNERIKKNKKHGKENAKKPAKNSCLNLDKDQVSYADLKLDIFDDYEPPLFPDSEPEVTVAENRGININPTLILSQNQSSEPQIIIDENFRTSSLEKGPIDRIIPNPNPVTTCIPLIVRKTPNILKKTPNVKTTLKIISNKITPFTPSNDLNKGESSSPSTTVVPKLFKAGSLKGAKNKIVYLANLHNKNLSDTTSTATAGKNKIRKIVIVKKKPAPTIMSCKPLKITLNQISSGSLVAKNTETGDTGTSLETNSKIIENTNILENETNEKIQKNDEISIVGICTKNTNTIINAKPDSSGIKKSPTKVIRIIRKSTNELAPADKSLGTLKNISETQDKNKEKIATKTLKIIRKSTNETGDKSSGTVINIDKTLAKNKEISVTPTTTTSVPKKIIKVTAKIKKIEPSKSVDIDTHQNENRDESNNYCLKFVSASLKTFPNVSQSKEAAAGEKNLKKSTSLAELKSTNLEEQNGNKEIESVTIDDEEDLGKMSDINDYEDIASSPCPSPTLSVNKPEKLYTAGKYIKRRKETEKSSEPPVTMLVSDEEGEDFDTDNLDQTQSSALFRLLDFPYSSAYKTREESEKKKQIKYKYEEFREIKEVDGKFIYGGVDILVRKKIGPLYHELVCAICKFKVDKKITLENGTRNIFFLMQGHIRGAHLGGYDCSIDRCKVMGLESYGELVAHVRETHELNLRALRLSSINHLANCFVFNGLVSASNKMAAEGDEEEVEEEEKIRFPRRKRKLIEKIAEFEPDEDLKGYYYGIPPPKIDVVKKEKFSKITREGGKLFYEGFEIVVNKFDEKEGRETHYTALACGAPLCEFKATKIEFKAKWGGIQKLNLFRQMQHHIKGDHLGEYDCPTCKKKCSSYIGKVKHLLYTHNVLIETRFGCTEAGCNEKFKKHAEFRDHMKAVHKDLIECPTCKKFFKAENDYQNHINTTPECREVIIPIRKKRNVPFIVPKELEFKDGKNFYEGHEIQCIEENLKCGTCDMEFYLKDFEGRKTPLYRALINHIKAIHLNKYKCEECNKVFTKIKSFYNHRLYYHLSEYRTDNQCEICGKPYPKTQRNSYYKKIHLWTHKSEEEKKEALAAGQKLPPDIYATARKRRKKKIDGIEPFIRCEICDRQFFEKILLKYHMQVHLSMEEREKFLCSYCGKSFLCVKQLGTHVRAIHEQDKLHYSFYCKQCPERFAKRSSFNDHMMRAHLSERPHPCSHCPKSYLKRNHLNRHLASCVNYKNYLRNLQTNDGASSSDLNNELNILFGENNGNSGQKQVNCPYCPRSLSNRSHLRRHLEEACINYKNSLTNSQNNTETSSNNLNIEANSTNNENNENREDEGDILIEIGNDLEFFNQFLPTATATPQREEPMQN